MKHTAKWIPLPSQPLSEGEALSTNRVRTYSIQIRLDAPYSSPKTATTRNIDGEFVWERLVTCNGRSEAVVIAAKWFQDLRYNSQRKNGGVGKIFIGKETHNYVTVDDNWNECLYGSNFNPKNNCNRLLDKKTVDRVIEESKGNLKIADSPFVKGQGYPSLEWATEKKVNSSPIKVGFSTYSDPKRGAMKEIMAKAVEREQIRKRKNQPSWLDGERMKEGKKLVNQMRKKGFIQSKEARLNDLMKRLTNSKRGRKLAA